MKKLFMFAMAAVFAVGMSSAGFAQTTGGTTEKKDAPMEKKADDTKMDKKSDKKMKKSAKKKDAANPCAPKAADAKADKAEKK